jgi:hypothetical protein
VLSATGISNLASDDLEVALRPPVAAAHVTAIQPDDHGGSDRIGFKWWRIGSGERCNRGTEAHGAVPYRPRVRSATDREKFGK